MPNEFTQITALLRNVPKHDAWTKERDRLGGKSGAVSSVSMAKSLEKFHKKFDAQEIDASRAAIAAISKDVTKYAKEVTKSTPKLAAYLNKQVLASLEQLDELLVNGPADQQKRAKEILSSFRNLVRGMDAKVTDTKLPEDKRGQWATEKGAIQEKLDACTALIPQDGWVDLAKLEAECTRGIERAQKFATKWLEVAEEYAEERAQETGKKKMVDYEPDFEDADEHWMRCVVPNLAGELNRLNIQHHVGCTIDDAEKIINKVCVTLQPINDRKFDPLKHRAPKGNSREGNELLKELVKAGIKLLEAAIIPVSKGLGRKDTDLFVFRAPIPPSSKKGDKKVGILSTETSNEKGLDVGFGELVKRAGPLKLNEIDKMLARQGYFPHHPTMNKVLEKIGARTTAFHQLGDQIFKMTSPEDAAKSLNELTQQLNELEAELAKLPPESKEFRDLVQKKLRSMHSQLSSRVG